MIFNATYASGLTLNKKNRLDDYEMSVLKLTTEQMALIPKNKNEEFSITIKLSKKQIEVLKKESGCDVNTLNVWSVALAKNTCTCESSNVSLLISKSKIEVPHFLLLPNKEKNQIEMEK
jgi:hypothetical protein